MADRYNFKLSSNIPYYGVYNIYQNQSHIFNDFKMATILLIWTDLEKIRGNFQALCIL